jgi:hypothetical protein
MNRVAGYRRCWIAAVAAFCLAACSALGVPAAEPRAAAIRIAQNDTSVTVSAAGKPVLVYRFGGVPMKPYVKELYTPAGVQVLRDSPHDHKHHHGLMFAIGIDGVDFWSENAKCGREVHRGLEGVNSTAHNGTARAAFTETLDWIAPGAEKPLATERRAIQVCRPAGGEVTLVTWQTRLEPATGRKSIKLGGSHYFGLGMRFVTSMDKAGRFFNADKKEGTLVRGQERVTPTRWCAYTSPAGGKTVTVAMFDDPKNPRHPAWFFTMPAPFAYLSATLNLWKQPMTVEAGKPLVLRYGVALWDGQVKPAEVEKLYQRWAKGSGGN